MNNTFKILLVLLIISSFSSCKVKQKITDVVIFDDNTPIVSETPLDTTIKEDKTIFDTIVEDIPTGSLAKLKDEYTIAIILPIFSDSLNINWRNHVNTDLTDFNIPEKTLLSLSFLEGMMESLEKNATDSKLNIKVYDNQASLFHTENILAKLTFENIDFIVGPVLSKNIRKVSAFAKKQEIIMISPFPLL